MKHLSTVRADHPGGRSTTSAAVPMAGHGRHRRALAAAAAVAAVALAGGLVACDDGGRDAGTAGPTTSTTPETTSSAQETARPATTASPTTAPLIASASRASSATTAAVAPAVAPATTGVPTSPEGYATAAFDAWLHGNDGRLRKLTTGGVADFLAARTPDEPGEWSGPTCDGAAGSTYCAWTQPDTEFVIRVRNEAVSQGRKHAVADAFFTVPAGGVAMWPFTTAEQAANTQTSVDEGHQPWLLDAATVAVSYAGAELGWPDTGIEQVQPSTYQVTDPASGARAELALAQPARQGEGGIWAVVRAGSAPAA
jgi:hypothetical protein